MLKPQTPIEAKLDVLTEAVLFLVRHSTVPNIADALIADLHRIAARDTATLKVVEDLAYRLRERDEFISENDA